MECVNTMARSGWLHIGGWEERVRVCDGDVKRK